jgi:cellobiose dehydrogenase (acceptor)
VTSRGRIGINSALQATPLVDPWFVDPVDKSTMIYVLNDIVAGISNGESVPHLVETVVFNVRTVPNLTLIQPNNQTIEVYGEHRTVDAVPVLMHLIFSEHL